MMRRSKRLGNFELCGREMRMTTAVALMVGAIVGFGGAALAGPPSGGSLGLALPWAAKTDGTIIQGCHSWGGRNGNGLCSSFDVLPYKGRVLAPMSGVVHRDGSCSPAEVRVEITAGLGKGWSVSFYHLSGIPKTLRNGTRVTRGEFIGNIGTSTPCGGYVTGAHTHMTLWKPGGRPGAGGEGSWVGVDFGGYAISNPDRRPGVAKTCFRDLLHGGTNCTTHTDCCGVKLHNYGVVGNGQPVQPFGHFDSLTAPSPGEARASGWAADPNALKSPIKVRIDADGKTVATVVADRSRPDVARVYPAYGRYHGFSAMLSLVAGRHNVCVDAVNVGPGSNKKLGCKTVTVASAPAPAPAPEPGAVHQVVIDFSKGLWSLDGHRYTVEGFGASGFGIASFDVDPKVFLGPPTGCAEFGQGAGSADPYAANPHIAQVDWNGTNDVWGIDMGVIGGSAGCDTTTGKIGEVNVGGFGESYVVVNTSLGSFKVDAPVTSLPSAIKSAMTYHPDSSGGYYDTCLIPTTGNPQDFTIEIYNDRLRNIRFDPGC